MTMIRSRIEGAQGFDPSSTRKLVPSFWKMKKVLMVLSIVVLVLAGAGILRMQYIHAKGALMDRNGQSFALSKSEVRIELAPQDGKEMGEECSSEGCFERDLLSKPSASRKSMEQGSVFSRRKSLAGGNQTQSTKQSMKSISEQAKPNMKANSSSATTTATKRTPRIGLLILTVGNLHFEHIYKEWEMQNPDRLYIKIHAKKAPPKTSEWLNKHRTKVTKPTSWGKLTPALMQLVKESLDEDMDIHRFVFICGTTIPLQTFDHIYQALFANEDAWVEPMRIDKHLSNRLFHKHQLWRAFNRQVAEAYVNHGHYEKYQKMIKANRMPWNLITDEFYFSQVAHDEGLYRPTWARSIMWTFWNHDRGRRPSSPETFSKLVNGSREVESLRKAKYVGVLFARKFRRNSNVLGFQFHLEKVGRELLPVYPQLPGHHTNSNAEAITEGPMQFFRAEAHSARKEAKAAQRVTEKSEEGRPARKQVNEMVVLGEAWPFELRKRVGSISLRDMQLIGMTASVLIPRPIRPSVSFRFGNEFPPCLTPTFS